VPAIQCFVWCRRYSINRLKKIKIIIPVWVAVNATGNHCSKIALKKRSRLFMRILKLLIILVLINYTMIPLTYMLLDKEGKVYFVIKNAGIKSRVILPG
jgi:hypothetical protein